MVQNYLNEMAISNEILDSILLILNFLGTTSNSGNTVYCEESHISILLQTNNFGQKELSVTFNTDVVLLLKYMEFYYITPLSTCIYKKGVWEQLLHTIISSEKFKETFNSKISNKMKQIDIKDFFQAFNNSDEDWFKTNVVKEDWAILESLKDRGYITTVDMCKLYNHIYNKNLGIKAFRNLTDLYLKTPIIRFMAPAEGKRVRGIKIKL